MESKTQEPKPSSIEIANSMRKRNPLRQFNEAQTRSFIEQSRIQVTETTGSRLILPGLNLLDASVQLAYHSLDQGALPVHEDLSSIIGDRQTILNKLSSLNYDSLQARDQENYLRTLSSSASLAMMFMFDYLKRPSAWNEEPEAISLMLNLFNSGISSLKEMCSLSESSQNQDEVKGLCGEVFGLAVLLNQQRNNHLDGKPVETVRLSTLAEDSGTFRPEFNADLIISGARIQIKASAGSAEESQGNYYIPVAYPDYRGNTIRMSDVSTLLEAVGITFNDLCQIPETPDPRLPAAQEILNRANLVILTDNNRQQIPSHLGHLATVGQPTGSRA